MQGIDRQTVDYNFLFMEIIIQNDSLSHRECSVLGLNEVFAEDCERQALLFDGFIFGVCLRGEASVRINGTVFDVVPGKVFAVLPKHLFSAVSYSADIDVRLIFVPIDIVCKLPLSPNFDSLRNTSSNPCVDGGEWTADLGALCDIMMRHDYTVGKGEDIMMSLVCSAALILSDLFEGSGHDVKKTLSRQEALAGNFFELLFSHFESERSVAFYADKLCVSPKYLSVAVRSVSGCSVQKWINEIVLAEAKRYLCTTEMTIQQISEKLHFASPSSFVRFFRQHTLTTPLAYRKD